jgi:hypothetical protein
VPVVAIVEVIVLQVVPLRRCNETVWLVSAAPLAVSLPVIEKACLTLAEEGTEMVRVLTVFASTTVLALQSNNAQITSTAATTITPLFSANTPLHLER